jgi:hypothetical protein
LWVLSITIALICIGLSALAFYKDYEKEGRFEGRLARVGESLYSSVELLSMHFPASELPCAGTWELSVLHWTRALAVIAAGMAGAALIGRFFGNELLWRLRAFRGNHVVVCGLTRLGQGLIAEFSLAGHRVVAIPNVSDEVAAATEAVQSGAAVLQTSPTTALHKARVGRASYLFAATEDDQANIAIGLHAVELARKDTPGAAQLHTLIHIADPQLRASLRRRAAFRSSGAAPRIAMFNAFDNCARLMLNNSPLDYIRIGPHEQRVVQIVLVGFGQLGEAVLTRAAMVGHYANLKRLRAIVIDRNAAEKSDRFRSRYPQFEHVCDLQFLHMDADEGSTRNRLSDLCNTHTAISTIAICFDSDSRAISLALALTDRLSPDVPIRVRINAESGLKALLRNSEFLRRLPSQITAFGSIRDACASKNWVDDDLDSMAKALHRDYVRRALESGRARPGDEATRPWEQLDDELVDSNRQAADHIFVKVRALGYHPSRPRDHDPSGLVEEFNPQEVELLAKMEHRRWMAERYLGGWTYGPIRDIKERISPYLSDWDDIPIEIQDYDRDFARIVPGVLSLAGLEIHR